MFYSKVAKYHPYRYSNTFIEHVPDWDFISAILEESAPSATKWSHNWGQKMLKSVFDIRSVHGCPKSLLRVFFSSWRAVSQPGFLLISMAHIFENRRALVMREKSHWLMSPLLKMTSSFLSSLIRPLSSAAASDGWLVHFGWMRMKRSLSAWRPTP